MQRFIKLPLLVVAILVSSSVFSQNVTQINSVENTGQCGEVILSADINLLGAQEFAELTDDFSIALVKLEDSCLVFDVVFGGGCGITNFQLIWDGQVTESMYPEVKLMLILDDQDMCKAMVYQTVKFNVSRFGGFKTVNGMKFRISNSEFVIEWAE